MFFFGTGAAEMVPNPFCDCPVCERARQSGETPRKRSAMMVDEHCMFDFGPEVAAASQMYGRPLNQLTDVFITHTHEDHFSFSSFDILTMTNTWAGKCLNVWLSPGGLEWVQGYLRAMETICGEKAEFARLLESDAVALREARPYEWGEAGDKRFFAVESNHGLHAQREHALNYLLEMPHGERVLYVCDAGLWPEKNFAALAGARAQTLVMECTFGSQDIGVDWSHLNAAHFAQMVERMEKEGVITPETRVYATHINQVQHFSHAQLQAWFDAHCAHPVTVAQDGMEI